MDDKKYQENLLKLLENDDRLKLLITKPNIQQFINKILNDEKIFLQKQLKKQQQQQQQQSNHHHQQQSFNNQQQISPLEKYLIDCHQTDEQNFLRLLIELIQQQNNDNLLFSSIN